MTPKTRRSVLAAVGGSLALAGCLSGAPGERAGEATTEEPTTGDATTTEPTATTEPAATRGTTGDWVERASNSPDADHEITLGNEAAESRTLRIEVVRRATGETVFEATETLSPGAERSVYNLREADPDGVEQFEVCAELVGGTASETKTAVADGESDETATTATTTDDPHRDCATVATSECYGGVHARVAADGSVRIIYAIC